MYADDLIILSLDDTQTFNILMYADDLIILSSDDTQTFNILMYADDLITSHQMTHKHLIY